jgi:prolipoprotein diacylglyceryltransferase
MSLGYADPNCTMVYNSLTGGRGSVILSYVICYTAGRFIASGFT